jgi:hypothetical protein
LIFNRSVLLAHAEILKDAKAPAELISKVTKGELVPGFALPEDDRIPQDILTNWKDCYFPGIFVSSSSDYCTGMIPSDYLQQIRNQSIITYSDFLEANTMGSEVIH